MTTIAALMIGSLVSSLIAGVTSAGTSIANMKSQEKINQANLANTSLINQQNIDYSKEFAQNQIQWKMDDLQAAGLNPVLAAQGAFGGSSTPTAMQATQQKAPMIDASGIASAITAMNNTLLTTYLMSQKNDIASQRNDIQSDRNDVLRDLYKRKAEYFDSVKQNPYVSNAKQLMSATDEKLWKDMQSALKKMPYKYKFK